MASENLAASAPRDLRLAPFGVKALRRALWGAIVGASARGGPLVVAAAREFNAGRAKRMRYAGFWGQVADIYWEPLPPATAYLLQGEFTPQCLRFDTPAGLLEKSNRGSSFLPCLFRFAGCTQHARQFPPRRRGGVGI